MSLTRLLIAPACVVLTAAGGALAQSAAPEDVLRGPRVRQQRAPGTEQPFADSTRQGAGDARQIQSLMRGIRSLNAEDAPDSVRLSVEQMEALRDIFASMRRGGPQAEAPMRDDAPRQGRRAARGPEGAGPPDAARGNASRRAPGRAGATDAGPPDAARSTTPRQRTRTGRDAPPENVQRQRTDAPPGAGPRQGSTNAGNRGAPDRQSAMAGAATQAWQVLTEEQQAYVRSRMDAAPPVDAMMGAPRPPHADVPAWVSDMPASLRERLDAMSAEQRSALWARLDRALAQRGGQGQTGRRAPEASDRRAPGTTDRRAPGTRGSRDQRRPPQDR